MPARLVSLSDPSLTLPDILGLDASVVLALNMPPGAPVNPNLQRIQRFWQRVAAAAHSGRMIPVLPQLAFEECCFKLCQYHLVQLTRFAGSNLPWHEFYKQQPQHLRTIHPALDKLYKALLAIPVLITEPEDLAIAIYPRPTKLMERALALVYSAMLLPKDATLLSEFERLGINTVATLDMDWRRVDGFTVITTI